MSNATILNLADELRVIADELEVSVNTNDDMYSKGTIVKARPDQTRFKASSIWVSLGNGKYKHLTGKKGLVTNHDRLDGFVDVVYTA
jgi:hypothetical protein